MFNPLRLRVIVCLFLASHCHAAEPFQLKKGDHLCIIGNTLADRMQHDGWLETLLQHRLPKLELVIRNLGFTADEIANRPREQSFGDPDVHLSHSKADVIFAFFGYNESFAGEAGLPTFRKQIEGFLDHSAKQKYNGTSAPRVVLFSPIAHENLHSPHLPDGKENNTRLAMYAKEIAAVAKERNVPFVDLFEPTQKLFALSKKFLTLNGIHLSDDGNRAVAEMIDTGLFGKHAERDEAHLQRLRTAIQEKNFIWFNRYRVTDGYNVFGGRSKTGAYDGQNNATISKRELEIMDAKTANRDRRVWAIAQGGDITIEDSNAPAPLTIKTNRPGANPDGSHPFLSGEEAINKMTLHKGMKANLFASEEKFPRLVNPVQSAVDPNGVLFVAVWPSYPHWHPNEELKDAIVSLHDDDGDGKADRLVVFADKLHNPTGFEFWGGGIIVASAPDLLFLKDTDGDGVADVRIRILSGIDSADTHHTANSFVVGQDGGLYYQSGIFQVFGIEMPWAKPFRHTGTGVYRFDPLTHRSNFHFPIGPNPHGDVVDRWGNQFVSDGTGGTGKQVVFPPRSTPHTVYNKQYRPVSGTGLISGSHFPEEHRGNLLIANAIGFQGIAQYKFNDQGSAFFCTPVEPILFSKDPNFRPTSARIGGDGALYVTDWQNPLIGHLQHNLRDPNRDHRHGRIYRITVDGQPLRKPIQMKGMPVDELVKQFASPDDDIRYRARLELTRYVGHPYQDGKSGERERIACDAASKFANTLDPSKIEHAQALTDALFVHSMLHIPNEDLLRKVLQSPSADARASATRVLRDWHGEIKGIGSLLATLALDKSPKVRSEAAIVASFLNGPEASEAIFRASLQPTDANLIFVLKEAAKTINVESYLANLKKEGKPLSLAAKQYAYRNLSVDKLLGKGADEESFQAVLGRPNITAAQAGTALKGLANVKKLQPISLAFDLSELSDTTHEPNSLASMALYMGNQPAQELKPFAAKYRKLATKGKSAEARRVGFVAWMTADGSADDVFSYVGPDEGKLREVLAAAAIVDAVPVRESLYPHLAELLAKSKGATLEAVLTVVPRIPSHESDLFRDLATLIKNNREGEAALGLIKNISEKHWPKGEVRSLVDYLVSHVTELPAKQRTKPGTIEEIALARRLAKLLPTPQADEIEKRLQNADVRVIAIGTVQERMIYDKDKIVVQAGRSIEFRFSNTDFMPHNLAIIKPGTLEEIGTMSETSAQSPEAAKRHFIPASPHVLLASRLLQSGESQALPFDVPTTPGVYPIVCTYPGHWRRMYASLYVVKDLKSYNADPGAFFAKAKATIKDPLLKLSTQGQEWTLDELAGDLKKLEGRSFEVGKSAFKVANCIGCHKLNGEGNEFGPDLVKLDAKLGAFDLLTDILEPSKRIHDKFQSTTFNLSSGRVVLGLIVSESPDSYQVIDNPLAKGKPLTIKKSDVDSQEKSKVSLMPKGLLDKLSREEVLDLVAFLVARGNREHPVFQSSHGHHGHGKE